MRYKQAKAGVSPVRQETQYSCMATSLMMALQALGIQCSEQDVTTVMGVQPMRGASWEELIAAAQHFGARCTLVCPATVEWVKECTDKGCPVLISWNPEGRDWSHASLVYHVDELRNVHVADPNIPNPKKTTRILSEDEFYGCWAEKWPNYLVRRVAVCISREIVGGRQTMASQRQAYLEDRFRLMNTLRQHIHPTKLAKLIVISLGDQAHRFFDTLQTKHHLPIEATEDAVARLESLCRMMRVDQVIDELAREAHEPDLMQAIIDVAREEKISLPGIDYEESVMTQKRAKYPKGKSIPMEEMVKKHGPEWKEQNEENRDNFKGGLGAEDDDMGMSLYDFESEASSTLELDAFKRLAQGEPLVKSWVRLASADGWSKESQRLFRELVNKYGFYESELLDRFHRTARYPEGESVPMGEMVKRYGPEWKKYNEKHRDKFKEEEKEAADATPEEDDKPAEESTSEAKSEEKPEPKDSEEKKASSAKLSTVEFGRRRHRRRRHTLEDMRKAASRVSSRSLLKTFGNMTSRNAERVAQAVNKAKSPLQVERALKAFNEAVGGFGFVPLRTAGADYNYYGDTVMYYVERGDADLPTLVYDVGQNDFRLTTFRTWNQKFRKATGKTASYANKEKVARVIPLENGDELIFVD